MANEIQFAFGIADRTNLYALVRNSAGQIWNGSAFVTYATASFASYPIALTEQGTASGFYVGDFATAGEYMVEIRQRAGGSPAESDLPPVGVGQIGNFLDDPSGLETGVTVRQGLRAVASTLAGAVSGGGTASEAFKAIGNPGTTRVTNAGDVTGNRTITLNLG